jgi:multimeric flavodoxin WrbA
MKVLGIRGSPRNGNTEWMLATALRTLTPQAFVEMETLPTRAY